MKTPSGVSWRAIGKVLAVAVLVWAWLQLWHFAMVVIVSIIIAVALYPAVQWLERRRVPTGVAAALTVGFLTVLGAAMIAASWVTLRDQSRVIVDRVSDLYRQFRTSFPMADQVLPGSAGGQDGLSQYVVGIVQSASAAVGMVVLALVLTVYWLIEWQRTLEWMLAFVPERHRVRVRRTLAEAREVAYRYAVGNVIAAAITGVATFVVLAALRVPAALMLAVLSGVLNFVPVIGFFVSSVLAAAVAAAVSLNAFLLVVGFYLVFNILENYLITPKIFGHELELSNLAVVIAVIAGAELGGVMGAILALPIAAIYPTIERIWLRERLTGDTVEIHDRLSA
jgi:predicted PurR-regulated permease PerM